MWKGVDVSTAASAVTGPVLRMMWLRCLGERGAGARKITDLGKNEHPYIVRMGPMSIQRWGPGGVVRGGARDTSGPDAHQVIDRGP